MGDRKNYISPRYDELDGADLELALRDLLSNQAYRRTNRARRGQISASREILEEFVGAVDKYDAKTWNGAIHWFHARFLADAFSKVLDGEDPAISLGVKTSNPGRRPGQKTHDDWAMAASYWFLRRRGYKAERANELLREGIGADRRTVQRVSSSNSQFNHPDLFTEDDLTFFLGPYAAIIESILAADSE